MRQASLLLLLVTAPALQTGAPAQTFDPPIVTRYATNNSRMSVFTDLDRDGNVDWVFVEGLVPASNVHWHLGDGTGRFGPRRTIPSAVLLVYVAAGDINGDGKVDIVASHPQGTVLHLGDGAGSLGPRTTIGAIYQPELVDIDGDGRLDLVGTVPNALNELLVMFGDGRGGFPTNRRYSLAANLTKQHVVDVDRDGRRDVVLVTTGLPSTVLVLFQRANGVPELGISTPTGAVSSFPTAVGDLDEDGLPDLVLARDAELVLMRGLGSTFAAPTLLAPVAGTVVRLVLADFDGDGHLDAFRSTANAVLGSMFARGNGDGTLQPFQSLTNVDTVINEVFDATQDGAVDLILANGPEVSVFRQRDALPAGVVAYGTGTPDCGGAITIGANGPATIGNAGFRLRFANAPRGAIGLAAIGIPQDLVGTLVSGVRMHTGSAVCITQGTVAIIGAGTGSVAVPIPGDAALRGATAFAQAVFLANFQDGSSCAPSPLYIVSSRAVAIALQ